MAEIRLNKLIRKYNIGLQNLVEFLKSKGADIEENPNAKIGEEYLPAIEKQFGKDLEMKEASRRSTSSSPRFWRRQHASRKKRQKMMNMTTWTRKPSSSHPYLHLLHRTSLCSRQIRRLRQR